MDTQSAASAYQRNSVQNAPPIQLVRHLYQGALRFLAQASQVDPADDPDLFLEHLGHADAIVSELRSSLDHVVAPELSGTLDSLYEFCEAQLAHATVERNAGSLEPAAQVLRTLLDAWNQVEVGSEARA